MLREVSDANSEFGTGLRRLHKYTWWSLVLLSYLALIPWLQLAADTERPVPLVVVTIGAGLLTIVQRTRFVNDGLRHGRRGPTVEHGVTFVLTVAAWGYAMVVQPNPTAWAFLPGLTAGGVVLNTPKGRRRPTAFVMAVVAAGAGLVAIPLRDVEPGGGFPWFMAVLAAGFVLCFAALDLTQIWFWDMVVQIDKSRELAEELAVARERLRFAADLHDIQGHHLQAIMLKGELTERLIGRDDDAARAQAAELTELARTAMTDTRRVVHGYRGTDLRRELANAVELLGAAGIDTEVRGDARHVPPPLQELFGALIREGTTNILRHSDATRCAVVLRVDSTTAHIRLVNDGITPRQATPGSGIAGLRERFATLGGDVRGRVIEDGGDATFELGGHAPVRR
ncbi:Histidine kinase [Saccharomonospora azurea SZMC 14600]|nr:Histidine kinase [Saccharomonospora azurea SZMC 14600]